MFRLDGADLVFTDEALVAIAEKAMKRKTGARGLRSIVENILLDTMYELPSLENVDEVIVNESVVREEIEPTIVYKENDSSTIEDPGEITQQNQL